MQMHRESHQKDALQYGSSANRRRCFSIFNPADTGAKLFGNSMTTLFGGFTDYTIWGFINHTILGFNQGTKIKKSVPFVILLGLEVHL